jgi:hypothetical protein
MAGQVFIDLGTYDHHGLGLVSGGFIAATRKASASKTQVTLGAQQASTAARQSQGKIASHLTLLLRGASTQCLRLNTKLTPSST